jgi:formylmethanofuran dehydrogenase subunit B
LDRSEVVSNRATPADERVACTGCSLVCVDVVVRQSTAGVDGPAVHFEQACSRGAEWLAEAWASADREAALVDGQPCGGEVAAGMAAERLAACRRVLVTGCGDATLEAVGAAADLAERLRAAVDFGASDTALPAGPVQSRYGRVTADFEELRDRADCVILWCVDLEQSHPRFLERFVLPKKASGDRRVFVVGVPPASSIGQATWTSIDVPAEQSAEAAAVLQRMLRERLSAKAPRVASEVPCHVPGLEAKLSSVVDACVAATCIGIVTGPPPHDEAGVATAAIAQTVVWLAHRKPAFEIPLARQGRGAGGASAAAVCTWRYGVAGAVAVADRDGGQGASGEADARRLLTRGEVDGVVVVGEPSPAIAAALEGFAGQMVMVGGPPPASSESSIWINTAPTSLATSGEVLRGDGQLVHLRATRPSSQPAPQQVLETMLRSLLAEVTP